MDSVRLAQMVEEIAANQTNTHSVLVTRNGKMVTEAYFHPYTKDTREHVQSVTKSVIGSLVGIAVAEGAIPSVDQRLLALFPARVAANASQDKDSIQLKHLLSMASGLDCQEFTGNGPRMEQAEDWVQFMLDLPMHAAPGQAFGYCNGNAHLLSATLKQAVGVSAREYANQKLFQPLGIPAVDVADWGDDPQGVSLGGYGLHLRPVDLAKIALLYLRNGVWDGQQLLADGWTADSTTAHVAKEDGSGYGYLWTVYPESDHYAALGLGGQQIHVYPADDLIVVVTAGLESYAEAPEIERLLADYILPAVQSDGALADNPDGAERLRQAVAAAAHPIQPVPPLPVAALELSGHPFTFGGNPLGWQILTLEFTPGADTAKLTLNATRVVHMGMDNLYRLTEDERFGDMLLRARWTDDQTLVIDYPYPMTTPARLGELGASQFQLKFQGEQVEVTFRQLVFGGEPVVFSGSR
jgi:CubicO group peptidase (beta-lactamase class C family)